MHEAFYLFLYVLSIATRFGLCEEEPPIGNEDNVVGNVGVELAENPENSEYPKYEDIPETSFSCKDKDPWSYYADQDTGCQVFHLCKSEFLKTSFLCPSGSIFNQRHLVCDWWYNFDCEEVPDILASREDIRRIQGVDFIPITEHVLETTLKSVIEDYHEDNKRSSIDILGRQRFKLYK